MTLPDKPVTTGRRWPLRRTVRVAAFLIATAVLLVVVARLAFSRRSAVREIARLQATHDRLQAIADSLEKRRRQAESDKRVIAHVLGLSRSAEDLPDLGGDRVVAFQQGTEKLCVYVPQGSHKLEISAAWYPGATPNPSNEAAAMEEESAGEATWSVPLLPESGYFLKIDSDSKGGPIRWELTGSHPDFPPRGETVPLEGFSQRGSSWSPTPVIQFPSQIAPYATRDLQVGAALRPAVKVMNAELNGVCHDQPYRVALEVRLLSDHPACVSASDAPSLILLGREHLLQPYAGGGKYELRAPNE